MSAQRGGGRPAALCVRLGTIAECSPDGKLVQSDGIINLPTAWLDRFIRPLQPTPCRMAWTLEMPTFA